MTPVGSRIAAGFFFVLALSPALHAQCPLPDGLDGGPCCATTAVKLPPFPKFTQKSLGICWLDCKIDQVKSYNARWTQPMPVFYSSNPACAWFNARLQLYVGVTLHWQGALNFTYSRTWFESAPTTRYQVWRFLLNGDLLPTAAAGLPPCPVPKCAPLNGNRVRFTGYIDYALDCTTGAFSFAWMLTHVCDFIDHDPAFPRGGAFHPDRAYTFVGPGVGFVPGPVQPIETGPMTFEALRKFDVPPPGTVGPVNCAFEEKLANGSINPLQQLCLCSPNGTTAQWSQAFLQANGGCGSFAQTIPGTVSFLSMGIGAWTNPNVYPGPQPLRWNFGFYDTFDACTGVTDQEIFFGVTTFKGFQAFEITSAGIGAPLPATFVDQVNSMQFPGGVVIENLPFRSDKVLNLNVP
jgi:hypothetical protein